MFFIGCSSLLVVGLFMGAKITDQSARFDKIEAKIAELNPQPKSVKIQAGREKTKK